MLVLFAIVVYKNTDRFSSFGSDDGFASLRKPAGGSSGSTSYFGEWSIVQIDKKGKTIKSADIVNFEPSQGFKVGRSENADFIIEKSDYVGRIHLLISYDKKGVFYAKDNLSINGTFDENGKKLTGSFDLEENKVYHLADANIKFVHRKMFENGSNKDYEYTNKEKKNDRDEIKVSMSR